MLAFTVFTHMHAFDAAKMIIQNIITYLGYGESFGPIQFTSSVNALPDTYLSFVSLLHRSVEYEGHNDFDLTDELTNGIVHINKIVYIVRTCSISERKKGEFIKNILELMDSCWHEI